MTEPHQNRETSPVERADLAAPDTSAFDLERLDEVIEQYGYAVFDPAAPGGVRAPTDAEYAQLLTDLAPTGAAPSDGGADGAWGGERGWPASSEGQVDEVARRTADPAFAYDPSAEWGEATYREPRSQDEADARTAHLDAQRALDPTGPPPGMRPLTEVEDAIDNAAQDASMADRAHDPDPALWERYDQLLALGDLRPLSDLEATRGSEELPAPGDAERAHAVTETGDLDKRPFADGPYTDGQGRRWESMGEWAATTARERAHEDRPSRPDDPARLQQRIDELRARLAANQVTDQQPGAEEQRRAQLNQWNADDQFGDGRGDYHGHGHRGEGRERVEDDGSMSDEGWSR